MQSDVPLIEKRLNGFPQCLDSLKQVALRYIPRGACIQDGAMRFGRHRKYDHDHYHITMFPPSKPDWLVWRRPFELHLDYLQLLSYANGVCIFSITLFGFRPSMQEDPRSLDRSRNQCLDIGMANETWIIGYKNVSPGSVYIGGRAYTYHENSGYFMQENGAVYAMLNSGRRVGEWKSLWQLLPEEIALEEAKLQGTGENRNRSDDGK
jgi:hypothetical protein